MSVVDDLITFVRQQLDERERQLDEDEQIALAADAEPPGNFYPDGHYGGIAEFLKRWDPEDPARVLEEVRLGRAEVEAKRRILDECERKIERRRLRLEQGGDDELTPGMAWMALRIIPLLAQPYAGQPGWREEWAV